MALIFYPEGLLPSPGDDELRSAVKILTKLFILNGNHGPSYYPEGSCPTPGDDLERIYNKINAIYKAI